MKQITLAVASYHDAYATLPPACIEDAAGKSLHSWRVLLLEFLDQPTYRQYDFGEPWNGPHNRTLVSDAPPLYRCPGHAEDMSPYTSYVVVKGTQTPFPGQNSTSFEAMTDGPSNTITIVEVADSGIHWMEPRDLSFADMRFRVNEDSANGISSIHDSGAYVAFGDGSVRFLKSTTPGAVIRSLLTISNPQPE